MEIKPLGDSAALAVLADDGVNEKVLDRVGAFARQLAAEKPAYVRDIVPAFASLAVHYDLRKVPADQAPHETVAAWMQACWQAVAARPTAPAAGRLVELPVCYGGEHGPDLERVAKAAGLSCDEAVNLHAGMEYRVAAVGFSPGFPYLHGLPKPLHVPRRATPRVEVPAGSVGIGGAQTGVYPQASPGGWNLIGRTATKLFDPHADVPALLAAGDRVRFKPVSAWAEPPAAPAAGRKTAAGGVVEVLRAGVMTTVQDGGRFGFQAAGVSPGGAMDVFSARVANLVLGNPEDAAVLEISFSGPQLLFHAEMDVAVVGARVGDLPPARPVRMRAGDRLDCSGLSGGVRAYLAFAGGIDVPVVLGGRGTVLRPGFGGFGGRALQAGDRLKLGRGNPVPGGGHWSAGAGRVVSAGEGPVELRFIPGVQSPWFTSTARARLQGSSFHVTVRADRMGMRLAGPALELKAGREMLSQPVVTGSIQVPPDGQPIILLADRQTIGGYPQIGHVITADAPKLAQLTAGAEVRFMPVSLEEAQNIVLSAERDLAWLRTGLLCRTSS